MVFNKGFQKAYIVKNIIRIRGLIEFQSSVRF